MLDLFEVSTPTIKCEIARSDQKVSVIVAKEGREFRVEDTANSLDWKQFIISPDQASTKLGQAGANALRVRKYCRIARSPANKSINYHRLKEGQAQRIGRKEHTIPWC